MPTVDVPSVVRLPPGAMPLANTKHEAFAVARARGLTLTLSYIEAGYTGGSSNASHLAQKEHVRQRIRYLKGEAATTERQPGEAWEEAHEHDFKLKDLNLAYYLAELRMQLAIARRDGNLREGTRLLYLIGAASGLIRFQALGRPAGPATKGKRGREAQEDHDGEQQQRAPSAPADASEAEVSEVLDLVDALGGGPGDEPQEEGPSGA